MSAASFVVRGLLRGYQLVFRPVLGQNCRFFPSCSDYALDAVNKYGPAKGMWMAGRRVCRCHPWNPGGYDPVP